MTHTASELAERFGVAEEPRLAPRYNIAPTQPVLIVRENPHHDEHTRETTHVVWGLIPPWSKDTRIAFKMINARAETAAEKPAFRHALKRRRCLVPASGFYEWKKIPAAPDKSQSDDLFGCADNEPWNEPADHPAATSEATPPQKFARQPYYIRLRSGELFAFAGLWEVWNGPNGETIESCAVLTTGANALVTPIHERMPVILSPDHYAQWLDCSDELNVSSAIQLLHSFPPQQMEVYPVSSIVNSVRNDEPSCCAPIRKA